MAFETSNTDMLLRNSALVVPKERGKANPSPKEKEKPLNMETEEKENLAFPQGAIITQP